MLMEWQKRQAAACSCKGTDEFCPCQNVDEAATPRLTVDQRATAIAIEVCGGRPMRCYGWKAKIFNAAHAAALAALTR